MLLDAGARVTLIAPQLSPELERLVALWMLTHHARTYVAGDMAGFTLVFSACGDASLERNLADEARSRSIPLNVADAPELCDFHTPAVVRRGPLQIAISTSGASPAFAARIRRELGAQFGPEYEAVLNILRCARNHLRRNVGNREDRSRRLRALADSDLPELVRSHDTGAIDALLRRHIGASLRELVPLRAADDAPQPK